MVNFLKIKYHKLRGVDNYKTGYYESAITHYESLWKITPFEHNPLHIHILCHYWLEEYDRAIELLDEGLEVFKNDETFIFLKENCYVELEDYENAVKVSAILVQIDGTKESYLTSHAINLAKTGQNEASINLYKKITSPNFVPEQLDKSPFNILDDGFQDSNNKIALNNLGFQRMKIGEYKEAIENFNRVIELDPESAFAYNNRGFAYLKIGELNQAIYDIDYSLTLDSENSFAYKNRALYYLEIDKKDAALANLKMAWALGFEEKYGNEVNDLIQQLGGEVNIENQEEPKVQDEVSILYNLGRQKIKAREFEQAVEYFNRAILINKEYIDAYSNRGFAYLNLGELKNGIDDINYSIEMESENAKAYFYKGLYFHSLNHHEDALINLKITKALGLKEEYGNNVDELIQHIEGILSNKNNAESKWYSPFWKKNPEE